MKEEDIRPVNLMEENENLHKKDVEELLKKEKLFKEVNCLACDSKNYHIVFDKNGFSFVVCENCETVFINPRPSQEILVDFYANSKSIKHWNDKIYPASENVRRSQIFSPRAQKVIDLCKKYNTENEAIFDVGGGYGTFCEEIKKLNIFKRVVSVEPSKDLADTCRRKGIEVIEKPIEDVGMERASVITNFELIEHLFSPKDFIIACHKALSKDGLLFLTTPNIKGFDLMTLGKLSDNIDGPNHINYFNCESLGGLLENCGFKVEEVITPGKLDAEIVRNKILNKDLDISSQPFLKYVLIDQWEKIGLNFQNFLAENTLSSHLWIVARKI
ncbi:MAG: class I SAM-dependent methyltransferase [Patescibacteria group bacterium]